MSVQSGQGDFSAIAARNAVAAETLPGLDEVRRICALPIERPMDPREVEEVSREELTREAWESGFRLRRQQAEGDMAFRSILGLFAPLRVAGGKCVSGDTEIYDVGSGHRVTADQVRRLTVTSFVDGKLLPAQASAFESGEKDCVRLNLRSGKSVVLSWDHPVLTQRGWVFASKLDMRSDMVATARIYPSPSNPVVVSDDEVKLVAYLMADGACAHGGVGFTNETDDVLKEFSDLVLRLGTPDKRHKKVGVAFVVRSGKATSLRARGVRHIVRRYDIGHKSKDKRLVDFLYGMTDVQIGMFVNRFWSCDGYVGKTKLETTLASEKLIDDLVFLLCRLGIHSTKHYKKASYVKNGERKQFDAWRLVVSGKEDVLRFLNSVGDVLGKESSCRSLREKMESIEGHTNTDLVPFGPAEFKELCEEMNLRGMGGDWKSRAKGDQPRSDLRKRLGITSGQLVSRKLFAGWVRESGYSGKFAWLATSDVRWDKIADVKPIGRLKVYDLSVPGSHNFVGNHVVLHNSIISYLAAKHAIQRMGVERALLLVPSDLITKAIKRDVPFMRRTIDFRAPVHVVGGLPAARRLHLCRSKWRGVYLYPYSLLREEQADEELGLIDPDVVVADECHALKGIKTAASVKRFLRMMLDRPKNRRRRFAGLSGTMAKRSLKDYAHLILLALPDGCPVPIEDSAIDTWASALDEVGRAWEEEEAFDSMATLEPMRLWAVERFKEKIFTPEDVGGPLTPDAEGYRRAFRLRRNSAQGVVASAEDDLGVSLVMVNVPAPSPMTDEEIVRLENELDVRFTGEEFFTPKDVFKDDPPFRKLLSFLWAVCGITARRDRLGRATTPNGDVIEYAIHIHKWAYELCSGFYHELVWPTEDELMRERGISRDEAQELLDRAKEHLKAERKKDKELRHFLTEMAHVPGVDTPMLVGAACKRHDPRVPEKLLDRWWKMHELDFEGRPERISRPVRVCDWKIRSAMEWAKTIKSDKGALIWTHHQEVGRWAAELFTAEFGPDRVLHCPSGRKYDELIQSPEAAKKLVIAALGSDKGGHSRGKDLQHSFSENFFLQWPRSADVAEQAIGRTHRTGQLADELRIHTNNTLSYDHMVFNACLCDAMWMHQVEGEQKIVYATYPDDPKLYPPEFLRQRGFDLLARSDVSAALKAILGVKEGAAA